MKKVYRVKYVTHPSLDDLRNGTNGIAKFKLVVASDEQAACDKVCDADAFANIQHVKAD